VPFFLFNVNHGYYTRFGHEPFRNWDAGLNVLNIEAKNGVSLGEFCAALYDPVTRDCEQQHTQRAKSTLAFYGLCVGRDCWKNTAAEGLDWRQIHIRKRHFGRCCLLFGQMRPAVRH
jgi:hypothetical protein